MCPFDSGRTRQCEGFGALLVYYLRLRKQVSRTQPATGQAIGPNHLHHGADQEALRGRSARRAPSNPYLPTQRAQYSLNYGIDLKL